MQPGGGVTAGVERGRFPSPGKRFGGTRKLCWAEEGFIADPPRTSAFTGGAGGGPSGYFAKPAVSEASGRQIRQVPEFRGLARSLYRGCGPDHGPDAVPLQQWQILGRNERGVSAVFSALWRSRTRKPKLRRRTAGQAAPYLYSLPAGGDLRRCSSEVQAQRDSEHSGARPHRTSTRRLKVAGVTGPIHQRDLGLCLFYEDNRAGEYLGTDPGLENEKRAGTTSPEWELRMRKRSPIPSTTINAVEYLKAALPSSRMAGSGAGFFEATEQLRETFLWRRSEIPFRQASGSGDKTDEELRRTTLRRTR